MFLEGFETPMIVQKKDGAFLYSTTDLATIQYRMETWQPDAILYVVDHRQSEHFDKLFAAARRWGYHERRAAAHQVRHRDGRRRQAVQDPRGRRRRPGVAARRSRQPGRRRSSPRTTTPTDRAFGRASGSEIAEVVGIGGLKYADLSQNRTSDYDSATTRCWI